MSKIQIIYCHPSTDSYTYQILEKLTSSLNELNLSFDISDLYALNFQSDMSLEEYRREGFANLLMPIPEEVKEEQRKLKEADTVIFLYPVWWSDCPAKLKGWFDRVYTVGYAYGNNEVEIEKKWKPIQNGIVICTAGHPNEFLEEIGIAKSMKNVMLDDRLGNRFVNKDMIILGGTIDKEKVRRQHQEIIESFAKTLVTQT